MGRRAALTLRPTRADLPVARAAARTATPAEERILNIVTWLADEKVVLAGSGLLWFWAHAREHEHEVARQADHMLLCVAAAGVLSHTLKHLVRRRRPDRTVVHGRRRGIPYSGDTWDSFPSGHALHLGSIAGSLMRLMPARYRPLIWPSIATLAATRILLLAHYPTDVAAGLLMGLSIDKLVGKAFGLERTPINPSPQRPGW
jgi:undecaprenyl-diphosphatase